MKTKTCPLCAAMHLLAEASVHIDEWNFPVTLDERITALLNEFYGENVRPHGNTKKGGQR